MANPVAQVFAQAAQAVAADPLRAGNLLSLPPGRQVLFAGDIHGQRRNLAKIIKYAELGTHPERILVLQELIHGGPEDGDRSAEVLLRAVRLKLAHPQQVCFLLGNHDLAQFTGQEITKGGKGSCAAFEQGLEGLFGPDAAEVRAALYDFLRALPLAARCPNGVLMTHSLPSPNRMAGFDFDVLGRPCRPEDLVRGGAVYEWTWGRGHTAAQVEELAARLGVSLFLLGHQPVEMGWKLEHGRVVIVASDNPHGVVLPLSSDAPLDLERLAETVVPIVAM